MSGFGEYGALPGKKLRELVYHNKFGKR